MKQILGYLTSTPTPLIEEALSQLKQKIGFDEDSTRVCQIRSTTTTTIIIIIIIIIIVIIVVIQKPDICISVLWHEQISWQPHIGMQLRLFYDLPSQKKHLDEIQSYWDCVRSNMNDLQKNYNTTRHGEYKRMLIFFTTDTPEMRSRATLELSQFGDVVMNEEPVVHTSKVPQDTLNSALLEWFLLGECEVIMMTHSSYGLTAYGRNSTNILVESQKR